VVEAMSSANDVRGFEDAESISGAIPLSAASVVLFLDVDGVLNQCGHFQDILTSKARLLRRIVVETGCFIVVSSTWRRSPDTRKLLVNLLQQSEVTVHDWTPQLDKITDSGMYFMPERGIEIQAWLDQHPEITRFVILDDASDMAHLVEHLVQTDSFTGLTEALANEVIRRLK
jgi:hypothetical protein